MTTGELRDWIKQRPLLIAAVIATLASLALIVVALLVSDVELKKVLYGGAVTLIVTGLIGPSLKLLLEEFSAARRKRDDAATFVSNVLADLKGVYDRVGRARVLIPAHRSVKTYGTEMRDLIEARVQLRNIMRALERPADGIADATRLSVTKKVGHMEDFLEELTYEFRENYKDLSDLQRAYEARVEAALKGSTNGDEGERLAPRNDVWDRLKDLEVLEDFISSGQEYKTNFEGPLDEASELLRNELATIHDPRWRRAVKHANSQPNGDPQRTRVR